MGRKKRQKPRNASTELRRFYTEHQRMPSYREAATLFRYRSPNAITYWVNRWTTTGIVRRDRTGRLLPGPALAPIRLLGNVQAGFPSPAEEEHIDTLSLDDWLVGNREASFMLKVSGDSMVDAGIQPGDYVLIDRGRTPKKGDIVIAEVDNEWTMKFFEKRGNRIVLRAANRRYPTIVPHQELKIAGVVTSVIRKYK
ncbi:repressor LexA [Candidatus Uhrbacteria bacterium CG10_big_fil_rev_8_21_14_0_10_48_11]|uniref:Repressor LexA n=1 Tax=Candidatus Uhrbacteria bacterium CG10_big_fil_rev_8_21_14_0_10_48_11 TaxID=1975037 RepID=A0A2M8LFF8_9BACT|nr:MAG: repressor LexA [Candidatus Uhrbacteria bacterium CG10_big_fil_rev_8_21_14_0_10_48_11]